MPTGRMMWSRQLAGSRPIADRAALALAMKKLKYLKKPRMRRLTTMLEVTTTRGLLASPILEMNGSTRLAAPTAATVPSKPIHPSFPVANNWSHWMETDQGAIWMAWRFTVRKKNAPAMGASDAQMRCETVIRPFSVMRAALKSKAVERMIK